MNNYMTCYPELVSKTIEFDAADPGVFTLQVRMLEDLRDEMADMCRVIQTNDDPMGVCVAEIMVKKVNRRIDFLYKKYRDRITS